MFSKPPHHEMGTAQTTGIISTEERREGKSREKGRERGELWFAVGSEVGRKDLGREDSCRERQPGCGRLRGGMLTRDFLSRVPSSPGFLKVQAF